ncbi:mammalian cell entry protein [Rubrivivax gelatinosus]|uniref:Mammalian cell entry protein n=1 Tax=Rubrivivax gelatinosus TaxID=28068 RepID=A0ABS1E0U4_RUBGE|nr:MlaD family protein [Rubrivivax gelatinosus]MBK1615874.1 mammalian cell entry protein [Rubrivivax gelatinosus]MBK1715974.1 mammalian cell entry protein [Rubrivivax gelatinosus]
MKRRANPTLIGAFVLGGLVLLGGALFAIGGGQLFARKDRAVMHFSGSVFGLPIGAPVVFRGVRVGNVESIEIRHDSARGEFSIPVFVALDRDAIRSLDGGGAELALPALVDRGLRAKLAMQSLLTGQLYVDLDLRPDEARSRHGAYPGLVEIPTSETAIQNIKAQLDGMDFRRLVDDVAAIAASARAIVAGPQLGQALNDLQQITANLRTVSEQLERRLGPLADGAQGALGSTKTAMDSVRGTAERLSTTAEQLNTLLAPDSPLMAQIQRSADELAAAAAGLRRATAEDSTLMRGTDRTLEDVSRAARAVRELADLLERHPEALLRGRGTPAEEAPR